MKLNIAMVFVCSISLMIFVAFPNKHTFAKKYAPNTLFLGECKNFGPNDRVNCNHSACPGAPSFVNIANQNFSGPGQYSLELKSAMCKEFPGCEEAGYSYYERVDDATCCDKDGDGYDATNSQEPWCFGNDCHDGDASVNPGKPEICNGKDDDCDGQTDEGFDQDGDGWTTCQNDCNDFDTYVNPSATDVCNGIDDNCNGQIDENGACGGGCTTCSSQSDCNSCPSWGSYWCDPGFNWCMPASPIVIDIAGNGFNLTSGAGGVPFDLRADGVPIFIAWTAANSDDAWLVLDRNNNGLIDNGAELFGNVTPQPKPSAGIMKNGFLALAEYDKLASGGNNDGQVDKQDSIFASLRLWQDINHNGVSEFNELHPLHELDVAILELDYKESKKTDEHGNLFKFRAKVKDAKGAKVGRWAWDIFPVRKP